MAETLIAKLKTLTHRGGSIKPTTYFRFLRTQYVSISPIDDRSSGNRKKNFMKAAFRFFAGWNIVREPHPEQRQAGVYDWLTFGIPYFLEYQVNQGISAGLQFYSTRNKLTRILGAGIIGLLAIPKLILMGARHLVGSALLVTMGLPTLLGALVVNALRPKQGFYSEPLLLEDDLHQATPIPNALPLFTHHNKTKIQFDELDCATGEYLEIRKTPGERESSFTAITRSLTEFSESSLRYSKLVSRTGFQSLKTHPAADFKFPITTEEFRESKREGHLSVIKAQNLHQHEGEQRVFAFLP